MFNNRTNNSEARFIDYSRTVLYWDCSLVHIKNLNSRDNVITITDSNVFELYSDLFIIEKTIVIPAGEQAKSIATIEMLYAKLLELKAKRDVNIIGIGGGVVTDITGFLASTYMRGVNFEFVPTTLLAQVDASIGGKNGLNFGDKKNIIGTINQAEHIHFCIDFLNTLSIEQIFEGLAEILKYALLAGARIYEILESIDRFDNFNQNELLDELIKLCVKYKLEVVQTDARDVGIRKILNFGHTIGHSIELQYSLSHGEAVFIGLHIELFISYILGELRFETYEKAIDILNKYQIKPIPTIDFNSISNQLYYDKKGSKTAIEVPILTEVGKPKLIALEIEKLIELAKSYSGK